MINSMIGGVFLIVKNGNKRLEIGRYPKVQIWQVAINLLKTFTSLQ